MCLAGGNHWGYSKGQTTAGAEGTVGKTRGERKEWTEEKETASGSVRERWVA